jgi:subtilisin family serine protease
MDVRISWHTAGLFFALVSLAACSQKSASSVFAESVQSACAGAQIKNRFIVMWEDGHISVEHAENKEVFIEKFLEPNLAFVKHAEFDKRIYLHDIVEASEIQTNLDLSTWGQDIVEASAAWNQGVEGQGVKVGVVDAAIDYTHPQINPRLSRNMAEIGGSAGFDDDQNGYTDDKYGWDFVGHKPQPTIASGNVHGTHVAGIILADHNFGPMPGLAPQADLVPANFMDQSGGGNLSDAILAINYVVSRGVKVINASWGGTYCSQTLKQTVADLAAKNVLFVAAAGNDGVDLDNTPEYPAAFGLPAQLTIGATRSSDRLAGFSNTSYHFVHLAAPGESIYSTVPGGYQYLSGTSMATPFVSGAAALLWSVRPTATVMQIKEALMNSVDVRDYRVMTRGRLNVRKALDEIKRLVP